MDTALRSAERYLTPQELYRQQVRAGRVPWTEKQIRAAREILALPSIHHGYQTLVLRKYFHAMGFDLCGDQWDTEPHLHAYSPKQPVPRNGHWCIDERGQYEDFMRPTGRGFDYITACSRLLMWAERVAEEVGQPVTLEVCDENP